jgi:hypothetical protein
VLEYKWIVGGDLLLDPFIHRRDKRLIHGHTFFRQLTRIINWDILQEKNWDILEKKNLGHRTNFMKSINFMELIY